MELFIIKKKINLLVYKLDFLLFWKIYNMVNIKYLLSYSKGIDFFGREAPEPGPIYIKGNDKK